MNLPKLVEQWFEKWEAGEFQSLPISEDFKHSSPYGTIKGKKAYLDLVNKNKDKFLGHQFQIHDAVFDDKKACIRYTAIQGSFQLEVSEWHYSEGQLLNKVIAYYNIGEPRISLDL